VELVFAEVLFQLTFFSRNICKPFINPSSNPSYCVFTFPPPEVSSTCYPLPENGWSCRLTTFPEFFAETLALIHWHVSFSSLPRLRGRLSFRPVRRSVFMTTDVWSSIFVRFFFSFFNEYSREGFHRSFVCWPALLSRWYFSRRIFLAPLRKPTCLAVESFFGSSLTLVLPQLYTRQRCPWALPSSSLFFAYLSDNEHLGSP